MCTEMKQAMEDFLIPRGVSVTDWILDFRTARDTQKWFGTQHVCNALLYVYPNYLSRETNILEKLITLHFVIKHFILKDLKLHNTVMAYCFSTINHNVQCHMVLVHYPTNTSVFGKAVFLEELRRTDRLARSSHLYLSDSGLLNKYSGPRSCLYFNRILSFRNLRAV